MGSKSMHKCEIVQMKDELEKSNKFWTCV
jgi:hypothetical protein